MSGFFEPGHVSADPEPAGKTRRKSTVKKRKYAKRQAKQLAEIMAVPEQFRKKDAEFAGMTNTKCATTCTADHCVVSTVGVCKHPMTTSASGCGPVTLANRAAALKYLKHQAVEKG